MSQYRNGGTGVPLTRYCLITISVVASSLWCCFLAALAVSLHRPWWLLPVAIGAAVHAARGGGCCACPVSCREPSCLHGRALLLLGRRFPYSSEEPSSFSGRCHGGCIPGAGESCLTGVCFMACRPGRVAKSPPAIPPEPSWPAWGRGCARGGNQRVRENFMVMPKSCVTVG